MKFLVDENISPTVAANLRSLGYNAVAAREVGLKGKSDSTLIVWAKREKAIILTRDLDFGFIHEQGGFTGIVILRGRDDSTEATVTIITRLHEKGILKQDNLLKRLVIATQTKIRYIERETNAH